ncbi:MAG: glycoside hydrolase family 2 TIM barrel-domain containing protein [Eubacteriales bacterium]|nr:glycoside hydrolase family 2 TIM barrel-domain containing protein [Eubacteriales bacterium]
MSREYSLAGLWQAELADGTRAQVKLPGTLDENRVGHKDRGANQWHPEANIGNADGAFDPDAPIATRFTRKYTYEGEARFTRQVSWTPDKNKRSFLEAERARTLRLLVNGREAAPFCPGTLSTPWIFEVTGLLGGDDELTLISDNSYPGLPHDEIVYSSAATDETQTNWNGVLGRLCLRQEEPVWIPELTALPAKDTLTVRVILSSPQEKKVRLTLRSDALAEAYTDIVSVRAGETELYVRDLPLAADARRWDLEEGNLYDLTAGVSPAEAPESSAFAGGSERTVAFGLRTFGDNGSGRLALNGRTIFLRSEANCGEFPETGHPPMTVPEWTDVLERYRSYGVNCVRFHSHCPPEEAFLAADRLGMLLQPELSCWNPVDAFETEESYRYFRTELEQVLRYLGNHPSFVMLTFGNELQVKETGQQRMNEMLAFARRLDPTRLYANSSNFFYGKQGTDPASDFYTGTDYYDDILRGTSAGMIGHINRQYPNAKTNYDAAFSKIRENWKKPVFGFEVGQFEVLPDFSELESFHGISDPANLRRVYREAERLGLLERWTEYVEATGELSRIGYREEVEAVMRTREMSGISLLGLQDFPGQGTALVGMMNSHLQPKPYDFAKPERFRAFFRDQLPLVLLERYTYEWGERLQADAEMANYGKKALTGTPAWKLTALDNLTRSVNTVAAGTLPEVSCPAGAHTSLGRLEIPLNFGNTAGKYELTLTLDGAQNSWPVWIYPADPVVCPASVHETKLLDEEALAVLESGGTVYLTPDSDPEHLPRSIQAQFTTDFWSVGTFPFQEGGMGQLIEKKHPLFAQFPTESHTNWQWWPMATQRALILPRPMEAIVTEMDSYAHMRPMAQLLEGRCGNGRILISSFGLHNLQQYPEARALLRAIYAYLDSKEFAPAQELEAELIRELVQ